MVQQAKSRTQRRMEKKQALLLVVLLLGVSLVSFFLGIMVGRSSGPSTAGSSEMVSKPLPVVPAPPPVVAPPEPPPVVEPEPKKEALTFYDALAKGEQTPLGSGINLPPESKKPVPAVVNPPAQAPAAAPVAPVAPAVSLPAAIPAPAEKLSAQGAYLVQIVSFRQLSDATRVRDQLAQKGYAVSIQQADLGSKGIWHRVMAGPYVGSDAAAQVVERLKNEEKLSALVKKQ